MERGHVPFLLIQLNDVQICTEMGRELGYHPLKEDPRKDFQHFCPLI